MRRLLAQEHAARQTSATDGKRSDCSPAIAITAETTPIDLAQRGFTAQGGEKFRSVQNMMLRGSVQLYPPNSVQSIPGAFSLVTAGDKLRMEIDARPIIVFKQIYDGEQSYSSMPNVDVPPLTKFGLRCAGKFDQPGFKSPRLPTRKNSAGFVLSIRMVTPLTSTSIRKRSGDEFSLYYNGFTLGTENNKFKEVEGVLVPLSFSQKFRDADGRVLRGVQREGSEAQSAVWRRRVRDPELVVRQDLRDFQD